MKIRRHLAAMFAGSGFLCLVSGTAFAGVAVTIAGNQAIADINLPPVSATVTITFDTPINLSADELNLSAQLVDPNDSSRLPACLLPLLGCVSVDPAFALMITVEPQDLPWLFRSGFESGAVPAGNLTFLNAYEFEVHTPNLTYVDPNHYRLFKAPLGGAFADISDSVTSGSVRARGAGGSFSQFMILSDLRNPLSVELQKELDLQARILSASIDAALQGDLIALLTSVQTAVGLANYDAAIATLDQLIALIQANAGSGIANVWSSDHTLTNDAGELLALAQTLRYTLVLLQLG